MIIFSGGTAVPNINYNIGMGRKAKVFLKYLLPIIVLVGMVFYFSVTCFKVRPKTTPLVFENAAPKPIKNMPAVNQTKNKALNDGLNKNTKSKADIAVQADSVDVGLPSEIKINVPFTSQAPLGVWDQHHEEACEEASLVMLEYYFLRQPLTPEAAENQIQKMIAFEIRHYGNYKDTDARQTADLFKAFYGPLPDGKKLAVVYDFSEQDLKKYLARGEPVIVPAAGRELGNPHYTPPGPLYHNLILIGYAGNTIITNDPGTKYGAGYAYNIDTLYHAIHDFPGRPENIDQGRKAMIVVE